jgi:hypothetical protein
MFICLALALSRCPSDVSAFSEASPAPDFAHVLTIGGDGVASLAACRAGFFRREFVGFTLRVGGFAPLAANGFVNFRIHRCKTSIT